MNKLVMLTDLIGQIQTNFADIAFVLDFVISVILILFVSIFVATRINRALVWIVYVVLDVLYVFSCLFTSSFNFLTNASLLLIVCMTMVVCQVNAGALRKYFYKPLKTARISGNDKYDREQFIKNVTTAVQYLSEKQIGALITIERENPLDEFAQNGTMINCPFTPEIVETIFYEGTRLHDGAVVVKDGVILAAAVMYTPSTKVVPGKLGARHRAALGISEQTDSVTIVVSEETGRISIAYSGMLDHIKSDEFEQIFRKRIA